MLENILIGFQNVFEPFNFIVLFLGVLTGTIFGALPGLTGPMAIALFMPLTYTMGVTPALLFLLGIYSGSVYGGSITAILMKIPGDSGNAAAVFDGYEMAQQGKASEALGYSALCSAIGGVFSGIILIFLAPMLANVALTFGPAEYFALALMGMTAISSLGSGNQLKSLISCIIGLLIAVVGMDEISGTERLTFNSTFLQDGIKFVPALIGIFAFSEIFDYIVQQSKGGEALIKSASTKLPPFKEIWSHRWLMLKTAMIGTWVGILPGTGATLASFLGYSEALRGSKKPETFGKGNPEGVIGPETANNAAVGGSFVPTLALGIPGSGAATLLISALMMHGMRPGPMIFTQQSDMVFAIMVGFLVTNFMFLALGVFGTRYFGKLLAIPYYILFPIIVILTIIGSYAVRNNMGDVIVMFILGIMGYFLVKKSGFPIAPIILGMVLGPMMENDFRRAFLIENSISGIIFRPIAGSLILVSIIFVLYPIISKAIKNKKSKA